MSINIRKMVSTDYDEISKIYLEGIESKKATFQTEAPTFEDWSNGHLECCRLVAFNEDNKILGWVALSPTSSRCVYRGVAEVSIYIGEKNRGQNVGTTLLNAVIKESEQAGIWTLQSGIFEINKGSIALHKKCGFRIVGIREKIGCDRDGIWQNTVLMERRSHVCGL